MKVSPPLPPNRVSLPRPPLTVVDLGVGEDAIRFVDADLVVAAARVDDDAIKLTAVEGELDAAVVVDVHLEGLSLLPAVAA